MPKGATRLAALCGLHPAMPRTGRTSYIDGVEVVPVDRPEDCSCLVRKIEDEMHRSSGAPHTGQGIGEGHLAFRL